MENPFDQFDEPAGTTAEANPFDQFDAPATPTPPARTDTYAKIGTGRTAPVGRMGVPEDFPAERPLPEYVDDGLPIILRRDVTERTVLPASNDDFAAELASGLVQDRVIETPKYPPLRPAPQIPTNEAAQDPRNWGEMTSGEGVEALLKGVPRGAAQAVGDTLAGINIADSRMAREFAQRIQRYRRGELLDIHPYAKTISEAEAEDARAKKVLDGLPPEKIAALEQRLATRFNPLEGSLYQTGENLKQSTGEMFPLNTQQEASIPGQVGSGFGQMAATVPLAMAGPVGVLAATASGSFQMGKQGFDEAIAAGADIDTAYKSFSDNSLIGLTEILPVSHLLARLDKITGGRIRSFAMEGIKQAFEEGGQEGVQQFLSNTVAQQLYAPERQLWDGVLQSAGIGALVGGPAGAIGGAVAPRQAAPGAAVQPAAAAQGLSLPATTAITGQNPFDQFDAQPAPQGVPQGAVEASTILPQIQPEPADAPPPAAAAPVQPAPTPAPAQPAAPTITRAEIQNLLDDPRSAAEIATADRAAAQQSELQQTPQEPVAAPIAAPVAETDQISAPVAPEAAQPVPAAEPVPAAQPRNAAPKVTQDGGGFKVEMPDGFVYRGEAGAPFKSMKQAQAFADKEMAKGTKAAPIAIETGDQLRGQGAIVNGNASDPQKDDGNYQKLHARLKGEGLSFGIETPAGAPRVGPGRSWRLENSPADYGYIKGTKGADGDQIDAYFADGPLKGTVYVIDQIDAETGKFDEHKTILGAKSREEAIDIYNRGFSDGKGPQRMGAISEMGWPQFKNWIRKPGQRKRPVAWKAPAASPSAAGKGTADALQGSIAPSPAAGKRVYDADRLPDTPERDAAYNSLSAPAKAAVTEWVEAQFTGLQRLRAAAGSLWHGETNDATPEDKAVIQELYDKGQAGRDELSKHAVDGKVKLYRGLRPGGTGGASLESYTVDPTVARNFAADGKVETVMVPLEDVVYAYGENEGEVIVRRSPEKGPAKTAKTPTPQVPSGPKRDVSVVVGYGSRRQQQNILQRARKRLGSKFQRSTIVQVDGAYRFIMKGATPQEAEKIQAEIDRQTDIILKTTEAARKRGAPKSAKPESLVEWVARMGGIQDPGGDLKSQDLDRWHIGKPGMRKLIVSPEDAKQSGMFSGNSAGWSTQTDMVEKMARDEKFLKPGESIIQALIDNRDRPRLTEVIDTSEADTATDREQGIAAAQEAGSELMGRPIDAAKAAEIFDRFMAGRSDSIQDAALDVLEDDMVRLVDETSNAAEEPFDDVADIPFDMPTKERNRGQEPGQVYSPSREAGKESEGASSQAPETARGGEGAAADQGPKKLAAGEVVKTATGRNTTPFPKVDVTSSGKTTNTLKRVDRWLMENALAEAESRGDEFNARQFRANLDKPQQADKDLAELYLFDKESIQPNRPNILKPLVPPVGDQTQGLSRIDAADKRLKELFPAEQKARQDFRAGKISDDEFVAAIAPYKEAMAEYDAAFAEEQAKPEAPSEKINTVDGKRDQFIMPGMEQTADQKKAANRSKNLDVKDGLFGERETPSEDGEQISLQESNVVKFPARIIEKAYPDGWEVSSISADDIGDQDGVIITRKVGDDIQYATTGGEYGSSEDPYPIGIVRKVDGGYKGVAVTDSFSDKDIPTYIEETRAQPTVEEAENELVVGAFESNASSKDADAYLRDVANQGETARSVDDVPPLSFYQENGISAETRKYHKAMFDRAKPGVLNLPLPGNRVMQITKRGASLQEPKPGSLGAMGITRKAETATEATPAQANLKGEHAVYSVNEQITAGNLKSEKAWKRRGEAYETAIKLIEQMTGITDLRLVIADALSYEGRDIGGFFQALDKTLGVAITSTNYDPTWTLGHEVLHLMRQTGLIDNVTWDKLVEAAEKSDWLARYEIERRYPNLSDAKKMEEAIAEAYGEYVAGRLKGVPQDARSAFTKIKEFFRRLRQALRAKFGWETAEDIFGQAFSGYFAQPTGIGEVSRQDLYTGTSLMALGATPPVPRTKPPFSVSQLVKDFKSRPVDEAFRLPFRMLGHLPGKAGKAFEIDQNRVWVPSKKVFALWKKVVEDSKFDDTGKFKWMNPILDGARIQLGIDLGLTEAYQQQRQKRKLDARAIMFRGEKALERIQNAKLTPDQQKALYEAMTGEPVKDVSILGLAEDLATDIAAMGEEAVSLGLISQEALDRNKFAYMHRVYLQHETRDGVVAKFASSVLRRRRVRFLGDSFKGRGMYQKVTYAQIAKDAGNPNVLISEGSKISVFDILSPDGTRTIKRVYLPKSQASQASKEWQFMGDFEVRSKVKDEFVIWRDFTKNERESMGEIMDARYQLARTYQILANDLATGRFFADIAQNRDWATDVEPPREKWVEASSWNRFGFNSTSIEWVKVPTDKLPKSDTKRWGALAGKYVRAEIWRDLNETEIAQSPQLWRKLMNQWKLNKTARSIGVHVRNVMSNMMFMDLADVTFVDLYDGIKSFINKDQYYQDAVEHGAFGADMISEEIRTKHLDPILKQLLREAKQNQSMEGAFDGMTRMLAIIYTKAKAIDNKMVEAYRLEDEVFRLAMYHKMRTQGYTAVEAAEAARDQFINYDIQAPLINYLRQNYLPFLSYTYRAIPLIAKNVTMRPWKIAKYVALFHMLDMLSYSLWDGDDEEDDALKPDFERQAATLGVIPIGDELMRLGTIDGDTYYLRVSDYMPGGNLLDQSANGLPRIFNPGFVLGVGMELYMNKSAFTGQEIYGKPGDSTLDSAGAISDHLWKWWMPSSPWIPGSHYWDKIGAGISGETDSVGEEVSPYLAAAQSVGIKITKVNKDNARKRIAKFANFDMSELQDEIYAVRRKVQRNKMSREDGLEKIKELTAQKKEIADEAKRRINAGKSK